MTQELALVRLTRHLSEEPRDLAEEKDLYKLVVGRGQPIVPWIRELARAGDGASLLRLKDEVTPLHEILARNATPHSISFAGYGPPFRDSEPPLLHAVRALACLGVSLVSEVPDDKALRAAVSWMQAAQAGGPADQATLRALAARQGHPRLRAVIEKLALMGNDDPSGAMVAAVTALAIAGSSPRPRIQTKLQALLVSDGGMAAALSGKLIPRMPACLMPDPEVMWSFTADPLFRQAFTEAWNQAGGCRMNGLVLWSLENGQSPVDRATQGSLGGAYAVLINEIRRRRRPYIGRSVIMRLRPETAIVGRVGSSGELVSVDGYTEKLSAARAAANGDPRVIVPADDLARAGKADGEAEIIPAESWRQAARLARRPARGVQALWAAAIVMTILVALGWVLLDRQKDETAERRAIDRSREYAARSLSAADADPALQMRLARRAWASARTPEARGALLSARMRSYAGRFGSRTDGYSVALRFDGKVMAVGYSDGLVRLWDTTTHRQLGPDLRVAPAPVRSLEFSPDGTMLVASALAEGEGTRVWEVPSGRLISVSSPPSLGFVAWRPDGRALLDLRMDPGRPGPATILLGVWDPRTRRQQAAIPVSRTPVSGLAVSSDGRQVAVGRTDGTVGIWRLTDGRPVVTIRAHISGWASVAFAPGSAPLPRDSLATSGNDGKVHLWAIPTGRRIRTLTSDNEQRAAGRLAFAPDGTSLLAIGGRNSEIQTWSLAGRPTEQSVAGFTGSPADLAISGNGTMFAVAGRGGLPTAWRASWLSQDAAVIDLAFHPTGRRLATAAADGTVRVWDTSTGVTLTRSRHADVASTVAYSSDGTLASAAGDGSVQLTAPSGGTRTVDLGEGEPRDLAFSPDGRLLVMAWSSPLKSDDPMHREHKIYVWDMPTLRHRAVLDLGDATPSALAFNPVGTRLLAITYTSTTGARRDVQHSTLKVLRVPDMAEERTADLGKQQIIDLQISPDGRTFLTGGSDRRLQLRDLSGTLLHTFAEHPATIRQVAISPDGHTAATTTTEDATVRLWDLRSRAFQANLTGHLSPPNTLAYSPDGRLLASGSTDTSVGLWPTDPQSADTHLCHVLNETPRCS